MRNAKLRARETESLCQQLEAERSTYLRRATDAETQLAELNREMTNMMARYQKEIVRLRQAAGGYQKEKS